HHLIGPEVVEILSRRANCLAINTQANAANIGFNTVCKYPHADYVCVSEKELRLEARQRREDLYEIVRTVCGKIACGTMLVTRGQQGLLCYHEKDGFVEVQALDADGAALALDAASETAAARVADAKRRGKKVLVVGNGGSAAIASHAHNDLCKSVGVRSLVFTEQPLLTALTNDLGYPAAY